MNKSYWFSIWLIIWSSVGAATLAFEEVPASARLPQQPLIELLDPAVFEVPSVTPYPELDQGDIKAIFYAGLNYQERSTRVFAYLGIPQGDKPVPAMVLVHGGGGTAFHEWVKVWNDRGYAAISMSLEGHMPVTTDGGGKQTHEFSGPARKGLFDDIDHPLEEQWMYHAVADCMLAHSLLASLPEVDADRIGVTGISWGGILSSLVSGVDPRLKCAIPVYGCGFLYESKGHFGKLRNDGTELNKRKKFWDPSHQFVRGAIPTLWVNGDSDAHFSLNCTSRSFQETRDHAYICIHPSMPHGHRAGWDPDRIPEIYVFADQILKQDKHGLARITRQPVGRNIKLAFESEVPIREATVYYLDEELTYRTSQQDSRHTRPGPWLKTPATVDSVEATVTAELPDTCRTYYVNLKTEHGHVCSSMLVELP